MHPYLSADKEKELVETANHLMAKGKGLLAADESTGKTK
jgi:fructose-bisphosphate aldolase class 1